MSEARVLVIDDVACGVSRGRVTDFLRVVRTQRGQVIAMSDGHTCGWDSGQVSLSAPVLDAVVGTLVAVPSSPFRDAPRATTAGSFEAARAAFLAAAEARPDDELAGGPAVQLTLIEIEGSVLRATWLSRMELSVFRGAIVQRVTREMSPAIERAPQTPSTIELDVRSGDLVTLSCRRWVGLPIDHARSDLLAALGEHATTPESFVTDTLARWDERETALANDTNLVGSFNLILAAIRV